MRDTSSPQDRLLSIRAKLEWAMSQSAAVEALIDRAGNDTVLNLHAEHPWSRLTFASVPKLPVEARLAYADFMHNLRSVLDHLVWHLVDLNTERGGPSVDVAFPIVTKLKAWPAAVGNKLRGFPEEWLEVIEWAQPFHYDDPHNHPAYFIHHVDIASKHHNLVGFGMTAAAIPHPTLVFNRPFDTEAGDRVEAIDEPGPFDFKEGEHLRSYRPVSPANDLRIIGVEGIGEMMAVFGPYRDNVDFRGGAVPERNAAYGVYVASVLEALAPAFEVGT
jgi:hypothetical protein